MIAPGGGRSHRHGNWWPCLEDVFRANWLDQRERAEDGAVELSVLVERGSEELRDHGDAVSDALADALDEFIARGGGAAAEDDRFGVDDGDKAYDGHGDVIDDLVGDGSWR